MQRIIKFRGRHEGKYNTYFVEGFGINKRPDGLTFIINKEDGMWYEVECNTIGQYTGLKDKNGKEICEGDIVSFNLKSDAKGCPNIIGYIEYQTTFSSYRIMSILGSFALDDNIKEIEVIGNVWEDSDLLNDSKNTKTD